MEVSAVEADSSSAHCDRQSAAAAQQKLPPPAGRRAQPPAYCWPDREALQGCKCTLSAARVPARAWTARRSSHVHRHTPALCATARVSDTIGRQATATMLWTPACVRRSTELPSLAQDERRERAGEAHQRAGVFQRQPSSWQLGAARRRLQDTQCKLAAYLLIRACQAAPLRLPAKRGGRAGLAAGP